MKPFRHAVMAILAVVAAIALVAACGPKDTSAAHSANTQARANVQTVNGQFANPPIKNYLDYHNFFKAQVLYDNPSTIFWCTTTWGNASAPLVTVPVAGKLTSSSVSLFPSSQIKQYYQDNGTYNPELPSSDAMYHGSPPPYRYGFTPGGQYVDFTGMPLFCTTALTKFQRQATKVSVSNDETADAAQKIAEAALAKCTQGQTQSKTNSSACPAAENALENALGGSGN